MYFSFILPLRACEEPSKVSELYLTSVAVAAELLSPDYTLFRAQCRYLAVRIPYN